MAVLRPGTPEEAGLDAARIDGVRDLCRGWVEQDVHKALAVLVARRGVIALHEAFGRLGPHGAPPLQRDSIFPMLSLAKVITATALMILVEDGVVGLTRPVQEYIPEFDGDGKEQVCVHHLLTHTSGMREEPGDAAQAYAQDVGGETPTEPTQDRRVGKLLRLTLAAPVASKPGEEMFYSNHNYRLAGEIVRRVSGCALSDFAERRIFAPLGMNDTSFGLPDELVERTVGWNVLLPTTTEVWRKTPFPEGGVWSTAIDMGVFGQMFLDGGRCGDARVLSPASVTEMTRDQIPGIPASLAWWGEIDASWGYGWGVAGDAKWPGFPALPRGTMVHSGGGAMLVWADPIHQIVGVYLSVCRYTANSPPEPITNVDLFVNAVYAALDD